MLRIDKVVSLVNELYGRFFSAMHQFQRLKIGDMFPDMTKGDCMALMAIERINRKKEDGILTVSELAEHMEVQASAVSRTLKSLEDKDFIERTVNRSDRRNTYVSLTSQGQEEVRRIEKTMGDFSKAVITRMNEDDMQRLITYLDELYRVAKEELELRRHQNRKEQ